MNRCLRLLVGVLALLVLLLGSTTIKAQNTEHQRAFVYGINAAIPTGYTGTFAPPSATTLYLLADQISVISPRITEIYFWPISNEYRADWEAHDELVSGTLELMENGRVVDTIESTDYTIQFTPQGINTSTAEMFVGPAATEAHARFQAKQEAFQKAASEYYAAEQAWTAAMDDVRKRREAGEDVSPPPEPRQPEAIGVFSNGLNQGFPIKLAPGSYQIQVRAPDGQIVPGSQRALSIIAPRRTAVGYTVVPETRWTTPDQVDDLSDVIIGKPGTNLYLEPHTILEYPARAYARLQNPQYASGDTADWQWVSGQTIKSEQLEVAAPGKTVERQPLTPFQVKQLPGQALGYEVQKFDPTVAGSASPDFEGYPIRLDPNNAAYQVRLVSSTGDLLEGSARLVRVPQFASLPELSLLPVVPLVIGALVIVRRRSRMKLPRNVAR